MPRASWRSRARSITRTDQRRRCTLTLGQQLVTSDDKTPQGGHTVGVHRYGRIDVPRSFWRRAEIAVVLQSRDIGNLFRLLRKHAGVSQTQIAVAAHMTQSQVSAIMAGSRRVSSIDVLERIADGLQLPDSARGLLGLAPRETRTLTAVSRVGAGATEEVDDPVRRRDFLELAGASIAGTALHEAPVCTRAANMVHRLAAALAAQGSARPDNQECDLRSLAHDVANLKRKYQACRYSAVAQHLPGVLENARQVIEGLGGDERRRANALSAEAHHVTASVLLKLDESGLAWLAADRSLQSARRSEDPLTIASSGRIVTHALMGGGLLDRATSTARTVASQLARSGLPRDPAYLSVYGSVLLRGAIADAQRGDRWGALELLEEARHASDRLGRDFNLRWTAFGPTNVQLHHVNVAVTLGDAGTAIGQASTIDLTKVALPERRACLFLDLARAYVQWEKPDQAYRALRTASEAAPEDVSARPAVRALVGRMIKGASPGLATRIQRLAEGIGVYA
ncbi:MAG: helix-turn-helix domain-containing protein [Carbonactinosporaceae bacterium]